MARKIPPAKILVNRAIDLKQLRYDRERLWLNLNSLLGAATLAGIIVLSARFPLYAGGIAGLYLVVALARWIKMQITLAHVRGHSLLASESSFPELHYLHHLLANILNYTVPFEIRVARATYNEPRWILHGRRATLVMPAGLLHAVIARHDIGQLLWLLGRMLGLQVTRRKVNFAQRILRFFARCNPLCWPFYNLYRRSTHFTADRIGLALGLSLIDAVEACNKMLVAELHARTNFAQLLHEAEAQRGRWFHFKTEVLLARPALLRRCERLVAFSREKYPDLYADFELHRQYAEALLPSYREIQEFSEGKEEERRLVRELGQEVYNLMSAAPPLQEADEISRAFLQLHHNRDAAEQLEAQIARLQEAKSEWENTVAKISAAEQKRETAQRALEQNYRELGRTAFACLHQTMPQDRILQNIFAKALQYQVVIADREREIAQLENAAGSMLDKSKHKVGTLALRAQNSTDAKRLQVAAETVGEEFWKHSTGTYLHEDLEPIKLRITGVVAELERRRVELDQLFAQRRSIESKLSQEGLPAATKPELDVPNFITQLKNQTRAAHALRPRLLETLGKAYWQRETEYLPETRGLIEQLNALKSRIRAFEQEEL